MDREVSPYVPARLDSVSNHKTGSVFVFLLFLGTVLFPIVLGCLAVQGWRSGLYPKWAAFSLFAVALIGGFAVWAYLGIRWLCKMKAALGCVEDRDQKLLSVLDRIDEAVIGINFTGTIISWNHGAEKMLGYSALEAVGQTLSKLASAGCSSELSTIMARVKSGTETDHGEALLSRKDGRPIRVYLSTSFLKDDGGQICGAVTVCRDITEQKNLEEQFRQTQKIDTLGKLAGGVAHDFNNLLTIIMGRSQILKYQLNEKHPLWRDVDLILSTAKRAASLTGQLLAFSRKEAVQLKVIDLNDVVNVMEKMLRRLIGEDIELMIVKEEALKPVKADFGQLEQVIMNLVVNARDAMLQGGKLIIETANVELDENYARTHVGGQPGPYVMLAVSDTGYGMDAEIRKQVFEPFFTTKEKGKGTGLGLTTVYSIVKQNKGNVWVYSEPGLGTTFKVFLPQVEEPVRVDKAPSSAEEIPGGAETILLVEDEAAVRTLAREALSSKGYAILEARHGGDALLIHDQHKGFIDLLLADVIMPQMSGPVLAERLLRERSGMKVLFVSGYTDNPVLRDSLLVKEAPFLQKPFSPDSLARKVREVLDGKTGVKPPVAEPASGIPSKAGGKPSSTDNIGFRKK
ncbi:MAG: ATP-binding protein [candidate division Zixibacteria bacterium]|nr:ATP-binding protein [candidate division Zixibacteria bacterium]